MTHERKKKPQTNKETKKPHPKQPKNQKVQIIPVMFIMICLPVSASVSQRDQIQQGLLCLQNSTFLNLVFICLAGKLYCKTVVLLGFTQHYALNFRTGELR